VAKTDGDGSGKAPCSSADAVLSRTLYDMHSLNDAIGGGNTAAAAMQGDANATAQKPASKTFKRSAGAGFRRNQARSAATSGAAAKGKALGAPQGVAMSQLTPEALESLDASNVSNARSSTLDGQSINMETRKSIDDNVGQPAKKETGGAGGAGGGGKDITDNAAATEPTTLEELADSILNSFLGKDVAPLREGKSTALLVNAGANVLHDVDAMTQRLVTALMTEQRAAAARGGAGTSGGTLRVPVGRGDPQTVLSIRTNRSVSLSELKRLRREYVKWASSHPPEDASDVGIATSFLTYVESQL